MSIPSTYDFIIDFSLEYIPFTNLISFVYCKYLYTASNNNSDASLLLYKGLKSNPEYPFGTNPNFISLIRVKSTSFATSYLFVISKSPSKDISESLAQSKNHGYPAITVCNLKVGLYTTKLSVATI